MEAYPFMWAKNKHIHGWCCVARPEFIAQLEGAAKTALLGAQTGTALGPNEVCAVRGNDPVSGGVLDLIYRRRPSDITDSVGRPVSLIEGFVLRHRDPSLVISSEHFDAAQAKLQPLYERFKDATVWTTEASLHSETIDVTTIPSGTPVAIKETTSKRIPPEMRQQKIAPSKHEKRLPDNRAKADEDFSLLDPFRLLPSSRKKPAPAGFLDSEIARIASKKASGTSLSSAAKQGKKSENSLNVTSDPSRPGHAGSKKPASLSSGNARATKGPAKTAPDATSRTTLRPTKASSEPTDPESDNDDSSSALFILGGMGLIGVLFLLGMCSLVRSAFR